MALFSWLYRVRLPLLLVVSVFSLLLCLPVEVPDIRCRSVGCEPRLPLDITWNVSGHNPHLPGTELTLVLSAKTDLSSVRLELLLPEEVSLLSGDPEFQGKLQGGEETRLTHRVSRLHRKKLQARVTAVTTEGLVFRRGATLDFGADGEQHSFRHPGRLMLSPGGESPVREFPALQAGAEVRR